MYNIKAEQQPDPLVKYDEMLASETAVLPAQPRRMLIVASVVSNWSYAMSTSQGLRQVQTRRDWWGVYRLKHNFEEKAWVLYIWCKGMIKHTKQNFTNEQELFVASEFRQPGLIVLIATVSRSEQYRHLEYVIMEKKEFFSK